MALLGKKRDEPSLQPSFDMGNTYPVLPKLLKCPSLGHLLTTPSTEISEETLINELRRRRVQSSESKEQIASQLHMGYFSLNEFNLRNCCLCLPQGDCGFCVCACHFAAVRLVPPPKPQGIKVSVSPPSLPPPSLAVPKPVSAGVDASVGFGPSIPLPTLTTTKKEEGGEPPKKKRQTYTCSFCDQAGHSIRTCPKNTERQAQKKANKGTGNYHCKICGGANHNARTCKCPKCGLNGHAAKDCTYVK